MTSETGIIEAECPASANERAGEAESDQSEDMEADNGS